MSTHPCPRCGCMTKRPVCHRHSWPTIPATIRFWTKVNLDGPVSVLGTRCWVWTGALKGGYGNFQAVPGRWTSAHRFSWIEAHGEIPAGFELDHLCRNPACCNPEHLEVVTHRENLLRSSGFAARYARQTHCKRGHAFTPQNTYINARGSRICRACGAMHARQYAATRIANCIEAQKRGQSPDQGALAL